MGTHAEIKESSHAKVEKLTEPCSEINFNTENQTRSEYFRGALAYLQSSKTFEELQNRSTTLMKDQKYIDYKTETDHKICIVNQCLMADSVAFSILPKKNLPEESRNRLPVRIVGDGNCLPRSVSVACFGHEDAHQEIRARIVVEMCTNINTYTDNDYLNKGVTLPENEAANLVKTYAMFSDEYTPGEKLTKSVIRRIFEAEALKVVEDGAFMGILQLFCVASVFGVKLLSIYPDLGDWLPQLVLHRTILPVAFRTHQSEILIMWTSTRKDLAEPNWVPNHFVPLIPQFADSEVMIDFDAEGVDENYSDVSLNDSLVEDILQRLLLADTDLPQRADTDLPQSADTDLLQSADTELPQRAGTDLPQSADTDLHLRADTDLPQSADTDLHQRADTDLHQSADTDLPQSADTFADCYLSPRAEKNASRYPVGTFLLMRNGSENVNVVVVQNPEPLRDDEVHGVWVQFYKTAKRQFWTLDEKLFFVCWEDIIKQLAEPSLSVFGSRLYYKF